MSDTPLISSLRAAVETAPQDVPLRMHLADLLMAADRADEAITHLAVVLAQQPASAEARGMMARALRRPVDVPAEAQGTAEGAVDHEVSAPAGGGVDREAVPDLPEALPPLFVDGADDDPGAEPHEVERSTVRLADVGGMQEVKQRLEAAFLAPLRNPALRELYGKDLTGGLLLYGPPGCGKTFIARAVAGEMGAGFIAVSLADVIDMYIGQSERNLREVFELARRNTPCVLFLDEVDAIGQKRSHLRNNAMRGTVNQLLFELDNVREANEGVFVLAASNHPWDVDTALRRPGRLDRTLLVLPPDASARAAILRYHLRGRLVAEIDINSLVKRTDGFSGADLAHVCATAGELGLLEAARTGQVRPIGMGHLDAAIRQVKPSIGPWLETARNVALFANEGGVYDDLLAYLKRRKLA